jgi:hypothetical protein
VSSELIAMNIIQAPNRWSQNCNHEWRPESCDSQYHHKQDIGDAEWFETGFSETSCESRSSSYIIPRSALRSFLLHWTYYSIPKDIRAALVTPEIMTAILQKLDDSNQAIQDEARKVMLAIWEHGLYPYT